MFAILAVVAFALALLLHLIGHASTYVTDAVLAGLLLVALHLATGAGWPALPRRGQ